jgi:hypothetical protein
MINIFLCSLTEITPKTAMELRSMAASHNVIIGTFIMDPHHSSIRKHSSAARSQDIFSLYAASDTSAAAQCQHTQLSI